MKTTILRRELVEGLDLTSSDHGQSPSSLRVARNMVATDGRATKRLGFLSYSGTPRTLTRSMLMQRRSYSNNLYKLNHGTAANRAIRDVNYPALGYGLLRWHNDYQPKRGSDWSLDFRLFTGRTDGSRNYYILDCSADRSAGVQWTGIRSCLKVWIDTSNILNVLMHRELAGGVVAESMTSTTVFSRLTDYHIGLRYTDSSANFQLYVNGALEDTEVISWGASEVWAGESSLALYPNWVWLNRLYVQRDMASNVVDTGAAVNPRDNYVEYPSSLECAAQEMAVYEIRYWSSSKDFTGSYPRNRPLSTAEVSDSNLKAYFKCDDGGGGTCLNSKSQTRPLVLLPNHPAYIADTGFPKTLGLEIAEGAHAHALFKKADVQSDALGLALYRLFGDFGPTGVAAANTRFPGATIQMQVRTPFSKVRRPTDPSNIGYLFSVVIGNASGDRLDTGSAQYTLTLDNQGRIKLTDSGATTGNVSLSDETVYTITCTRSSTGTISIYLDSNTAASTTAAIAAAPGSLGTAVSLCVGSVFPFNGNRSAANISTAFRMSWLRVWKRELTQAERLATITTHLTPAQRADTDLLVNAEVQEVTGDTVPSICSYPLEFRLAQQTNHGHLGPNTTLGPEWWDAWPNSCPPYFGNHDQTRSYDPVGYEGACELVASQKSPVSRLGTLATVNHGVFHTDSDLNGDFEAVTCERTTGVREYYAYRTNSRVRSVGATDRLFLFHEEGYPKVYTGRALVPLGIDLPFHSRLPEGNACPIVAQGPNTGGLTDSKYYSYIIVYVDELNNVVEVLGPTKSVQSAATGANTGTLIIGSTNVNSTTDDDRLCIRRHLNPRVSRVDIYRCLGADSSDLAEAGPFFLYLRQPNYDQAQIDGVSDAVLATREAFDDRFKRPPQASYGDIYDGRMILGGFSASKSVWIASESGNPEMFDEEGFEETEDGTGGIITGIKKAFGFCYIFKTNSIWQVVSNTGSLEAREFTTAVGCVAPGSITEFFSPRHGQRVLFFWASDGPYIFDGNQPLFIGQKLKGDPNIEPYLAINDISQIYVRNIEKLGQLWVFFVPQGRTDYEQIYAYDYIGGRWLDHTGLRFTDFAGIALGANARPTYIAGSKRGQYYKVFESTRDGPPAIVTSVFGTDIDAASTTILLKTTGVHADWFAGIIRDHVITIIRANGTQERRWILESTSDGFNGYIVPEEPWTTAPAPGDSWIIGGIDFKIEVPWDTLENDTADNFIHYLRTYQKGILFHRTSVDQAALSGNITAISSTGDGERNRTYINKHCEMVKLELSNPFADSPVTIQSYGYEMGPTKSTVRTE